MRTVALVSRDGALASRTRRVLGDAFEILVVDSVESALGPERAPLADVVLVDLGSARVDPEAIEALVRRPDRPYLIALATDGAHGSGAERCDLLLSPDAHDAALRSAVDQGLRSQRVERELAVLRRERARQPPVSAAPPAAAPGAIGTVLKEMGKLLAAHFDLERVVDFFLDAVTELVRPGRVAFLLADEERRYRVRAHRGLDPTLTEHLRLVPGEGLALWFRHSGRLAIRQQLEHDPEWHDVARELALLGGDVAVPLWVQARLVGILTLGPRVAGQPYGAEDLERLFTLAGQVAMAVEDISLFNTVRAQHAFIEQVLAHLQSGAVTIDPAGRVTRLNRRAAEILGLEADEVIGQDLRALPSPLGDLLFEAVRGGRELRLQEVQLPRRPGFGLEVSTARIVGASGAPAGAVMLLDDPTPRHLLHRERQNSQTLDLLNRVLLRLTDEIKNPLVSIYTFLELMPERYDDPEFRNTFLSIVGRDTRHLISLVDKLITLAGEREYKSEFCDLRQILDEALGDLALRFERSPATEATLFLLQAPERADHLTAVLSAPPGDLTIRADREQLTKALGYLLRFLVDRVEPDGRVAIHVLADPEHPGTVRVSILGRPASLSPPERDRLFSPLAIASERLLDVGPSVSQKIVEAHGGSLTLGGQEGEIRFSLTLPRTSTDT